MMASARTPPPGLACQPSYWSCVREIVDPPGPSLHDLRDERAEALVWLLEGPLVHHGKPEVRQPAVGAALRQRRAARFPEVGDARVVGPHPTSAALPGGRAPPAAIRTLPSQVMPMRTASSRDPRAARESTAPMSRSSPLAPALTFVRSPPQQSAPRTQPVVAPPTAPALPWSVSGIGGLGVPLFADADLTGGKVKAFFDRVKVWDLYDVANLKRVLDGRGAAECAVAHKAILFYASLSAAFLHGFEDRLGRFVDRGRELEEQLLPMLRRDEKVPTLDGLIGTAHEFVSAYVLPRTDAEEEYLGRLS